MKNHFKLIFVAFLLLISINLVSALTLNTFWLENDQDEISISNGESTTIVMEIGDIETSTSLFIDIALDGNGIYSNVVDPIGGTFETIYTIVPEDYNNQIGEYEVSVQVWDTVEFKTNFLELNVIGENTAPWLDDLPDQYLQKNSGFNNNLINLNEYAHDNEGDELTFTIIQESNTNVVDCNIDENGYLDCNVMNNMIGNSFIIIEVSDGELTDTESLTVYVQEEFENTLPSINIIKPINNEVISGICNILWIATDNEQDDSTLDIKIEYQLYNEILNDEWNILENSVNNNDGIFGWNTFNVDDGQYILRITVKDDENAVSYDEVVFYIDNIAEENNPPSVYITSPTHLEEISGFYNIEWDAFDLDQSSNSLDVKIKYKEENWFGDNIIDGIVEFLGLDSGWITIFSSSNNPGNVLWNTLPIDDGNYKLRVTVIDDFGEEDKDDVLFEINNEIGVNHDPVIISEPVTVAYANELYTYDVDAIDIDGDTLTYLFDTNVPDRMSINSNTGLITWTPSQEASYPIKVKVIDGKGGEDTQEYTLNVYEEEIPVEVGIIDRHKFSIANVITKEKSNYLDVYVYVRNKGNKKEDVTLRAIIMQTGDTIYDNFNLDVYEGKWRFLRFNKPLKGNYVVRVDAHSNDYRDVRYMTVKI